MPLGSENGGQANSGEGPNPPTMALRHAYYFRNPIHTMQEAHRCLTPGGWFLTLPPSTDGRGAFQDPTHVSFWSSNSFWYYTRPEQARFIHSPSCSKPTGSRTSTQATGTANT